MGAPVEPQYEVDTHPLSAAEGLSLPPSFLISVTFPTQEQSDTDLQSSAVESMKTTFQNTVDWHEWPSNIAKGILIDKVLKACTAQIADLVEKCSQH